MQLFGAKGTNYKMLPTIESLVKASFRLTYPMSPVRTVGYYNPKAKGGSWLNKDSGSGLGEPLNVSEHLIGRLYDNSPPKSRLSYRA